MIKTLLSIFILFSLLSSSIQAQNALSLDGVNDYVQTGFDGITGTNPRTVEAWIKTDLISTQEVIVDWGNMSTGSRFTLNLINGKLRCEIGGQGSTSPTTVVADTNWHHVAVVFDPTATYKFSLYVDGVLDHQYNLSIAMNTLSTTNMRIGRRIDNANPINGKIDEVRVWDYARTQSQIATNMYTEYCQPETGLVAYFKFNEGVANGTNTGLNTANNAVNSAENGTLNGFALSGSTSNWTTGYPMTVGFTTDTITGTGCDGSYTSPSGNTWTTSGTYFDTISNAYGCDSVLTINLDFSSSSSATISVDGCGSYILPSGADTVYASGMYMDTIANAVGCDSVLTINFTQLNTTTTLDGIGCESYTMPSGAVVTQSGTYLDTIPNAAGCDSIFTVNVIIGQNYQENVEVTSCFDFTSPSGKYFTESSVFSDTLTSVLGCDSIVTFDLTVKSFDVSVSTTSSSLINTTFNPDSLQWLDCENDFEPIAGATSNIYTPGSGVTGEFALQVWKEGCVDTSECILFNPLGIDDWSQQTLKVFPNPTNGNVFLSAEISTLKIYDLTGQEVKAEVLVKNGMTELVLPVHSGVYIFDIQGDIYRIVKQ